MVGMRSGSLAVLHAAEGAVVLGGAALWNRSVAEPLTLWLVAESLTLLLVAEPLTRL